MTFAEVEQILEDFGFRRRGTRGSHNWFHRKGVGQISIPTKGGRWVRQEYLDEVCALLNLDAIGLDQLDALLEPEEPE